MCDCVFGPTGVYDLADGTRGAGQGPWCRHPWMEQPHRMVRTSESHRGDDAGRSDYNDSCDVANTI